MKPYSVLLLAAIGCYAQVQGPYTASINFATNLNGPQDTRPETWGTSEATSWTVTFNPPAGYRVRILAIDGDFVSWIVTLPGDDTVVPLQSAAGVLLSLQTSDPVSSGRCDFCVDLAPHRQPVNSTVPVQSTTILYIQDSLAQLMPKSRAAYDRPAINALLNTDNQLVVNVASWLNTTGKLIHIEPTFIATYQFEIAGIPIPVAPAVLKAKVK